jgi:hypothetical protein
MSNINTASRQALAEPQTLLITRDMVAEDGAYTGPDVSHFDGHICIDAGLGTVWFGSWLRASLSITAKAGSGIKAGCGIEAGWGIEAGEGIKAGAGIEAGWGIKAGWGIEAGWGIKAGEGINAGSGIKAGEGIEAGWGIEAGEGIEAGSGIEAGLGIEAGWGIEAGLGIEAGWGIEAKWFDIKLRIFAGLCMSRLPRPEELEIRGELRQGIIAHGTHVQPAEG